MCPDRELLSAFVDGEVPEPWNGRLASHLSVCDSCAKAAEGFRALSRLLGLAAPASAAEDESALLSRIGSGLDRTLAARELRRVPRRPGFFRGRSIILPLPAVAAAALVLAAVLALSLLGILSPGNRAAAALAVAPAPAALQASATAELPPALAQSANMDELLRYLDSKNGQVTLTIRLPTGASFERLGAPVLQVAGPPDSTPKDGSR